jgi:diadenosine tetraphosphate (Ap4A) HIT family hydrolase
MFKEKLKKTLFGLARSNVSGFFIGFIFENLSSLIPVEKITENKRVIVFYHPVKHWEKHILIVPKKSTRSFLSFDFNNSRDQDLLTTILKEATQTARLLKMDTYTILVNGGKYQDVPQVHFHLASGKDKQGVPLGQEEYGVIDKRLYFSESDNTYVQQVHSSKGKKHLVLLPKKAITSIGGLNFDDDRVRFAVVDLLKTAQEAVRQLNPKGYTLLVNQKGERFLSFHLLYEK